MVWSTPVIIAVGIVIVLVEGVALLNKTPDDTISEHFWKWLKVRDKSKNFTAWRFFVLFFMLWLTGHLTFGWWAG